MDVRIHSSVDALRDVPRVPHAEGKVNSGIQSGVGGNPPDRLYIRQTAEDMVDAAVALSRLSARKRGKMPTIPGGLDDKDERLYDKSGPFGKDGKMHVAQKAALTADDVARLKAGKPEQAHEDSSGPRREGFKGESGSAGRESSAGDAPRLCSPRDGDFLPDIGGPAGSVPAEAPVAEQSPNLTPDNIARDVAASVQVVYRDRVVDRPVEKIVEKVVEVDRPSPWSEWVKRRVRVEIATQDMSFNVSAIDVIRSAYGMTVLLPTDGGAMTFTPKIGSDVTISGKDFGQVRTKYTGVSFDIGDIGVFGLCFLIPKDLT